jgi:cytochrome o ubiquinol oxidase subunit 2
MQDPIHPTLSRRLRRAALAAAFGALPWLSGCTLELLDPRGAVGAQERTLILAASGLMLLVVVPVIALTLAFAWRYRAGNARAAYAPTWTHSTRIELVVWTIPCVIVAVLGAMIWRTTRTLDPYAPLVSDVPPLRVQVVALNWKWLFIYPDLGIATVNRLEIPAGTPVDFELGADSLMNSFFIPQLGSQVYAMAGMRTQLHLVADTPGTYRGESAAFSGEGFSDMHFDAVAARRADFDAWVAQARRSPLALDAATYRAVSRPGTSAAATVYAGVEPGLFDAVVARYERGRGDARICTARPAAITE